MQDRIVGQGAVGPHPDQLPVGLDAWLERWIRRDVPRVDRSGPVDPVADPGAVWFQPGLVVGERLGRRHVGRWFELVVETRFGIVEAGLQVEDRATVLDRDDSSGGEAATVAQAVDLVEDRYARVARSEEVRVQRMDVPAGFVDRAGRRDERLAGDLAPEHPLAVFVGLDAPEDVDLDRLEVEQVDQVT